MRTCRNCSGRCRRLSKGRSTSCRWAGRKLPARREPFSLLKFVAPLVCLIVDRVGGNRAALDRTAEGGCPHIDQFAAANSSQGLDLRGRLLVITIVITLRILLWWN